MKGIVLIAALIFQQPSPPESNVLSGQIRFFDGEPAANLDVIAVPTGSPSSSVRSATKARTNAEGIFRFEGLPAGAYWIQTAPVGPHTFFPGVGREAEATAVAITANSTIENLNFRLTAPTSGVRVTGRIVVPEGLMVRADAMVRVYGGIPFQRREGGIASDGTFEVRNVRPGTHTVSVSDDRTIPPAQITVTDRDVDGVELVAPRLITLRGTVTMDPPASVPELGLTFMRQNASFRAGTLSNGGVFQIQLPAGMYSVSVSNLTQSHFIKSVTAETVNLQEDFLRLDDSLTEKPLSITLGTSPGVNVAGHVEFDGDIEAGITHRLLVWDRLTGRQYETGIGADRSFRLQAVMPGRYLATVLASDAVSPPTFSFTIPETNLTDTQIPVPGLVEVSGRVTVEGSGPPPKFQFALVRGNVSAGFPEAGPGQLPVLNQTTAAQLLHPVGGTQILEVAVNALRDGTFKFKVPAGEYRMATIGAGIPPQFLLRSVNYGSVRLREEPLIVAATGPAEQLQFGFGPAASNPWVKISGRVLGIDAAASPLRLALEGTVTSAIEAPVNPDGSFEFRTLLRDSIYTARLVPEIDSAPAPEISVTDQDLANVLIEVPRRRDVVVRTMMEGGGTAPEYMLSLAGSSTTVQVTVLADASGASRVSMPEDERKVQIAVLPFGYVVKGITYGSTDLRKTPLKLFGTPADSEVRVTLSTDPAVPLTTIRGRISGLAAESRGRLVLRSAAAAGTFETAVAPDGTFEISRIPQGLYVPTFVEGDSDGTVSPSLIAVKGADDTRVELVTNHIPSRTQPALLAASSGARVTDFGGPGGGGDSAAVASLRTINTALITFLSSTGRYGTIAEMIDAGLLDKTFAADKGGYRFAVVSIDGEYAAAAIPVSSASRYGYFSTADAVVRYSTVNVLAPPSRSGTPVQ